MTDSELQSLVTIEFTRLPWLSGVDELTYARGVQRLMDAKRQGLYPSGQAG